MLPGYLRKNGVPYSDATTVTEYYDQFTEADGQAWFTITTIVNDPKYLAVFNDVVGRAAKSTYRIQCDGKDTALGVAVDKDGYLLTKFSDLTGRLGNGIRGPAVVAAIAAAITAVFTVAFLMRYFKTRTLIPFAVYCVVFGLAMVIYNA